MSHGYKTESPHFLSLPSLFNILYILIMSPLIHLLSEANGCFQSALQRVLALSFLLILSEAASLRSTQ